jgi:hypothetical protein
MRVIRIIFMLIIAGFLSFRVEPLSRFNKVQAAVTAGKVCKRLVFQYLMGASAVA